MFVSRSLARMLIVVLHIGHKHFRESSSESFTRRLIVCKRQCRQKEWPQVRVTGLQNRDRQIGHTRCFRCSSNWFLSSQTPFDFVFGLVKLLLFALLLLLEKLCLFGDSILLSSFPPASISLHADSEFVGVFVVPEAQSPFCEDCIFYKRLVLNSIALFPVIG